MRQAEAWTPTLKPTRRSLKAGLQRLLCCVFLESRVTKTISRTPDEQTEWARRSHRERCRIVASVQRQIVDSAERLIEACTTPQRSDPVETLSAELLPLCAALKYIGQRGPKLLRPKKLGTWGRPLWLWGVRSEVHRVPLGEVLILAAWNYPLLLPGVQAAQALAAGNSVWLKPASGCEKATELLTAAFHRGGVPETALRLLPTAPEAATERIEQGVDLVVLTGSARTGRSVMTQCASTLTPTIMELSGCDALIVGPGADLQRVADAVAFGLTFNGGATCIGPRRIIVHPQQHRSLTEHLRARFADAGAQVVHPSARSAAHEMIADAFARGGVDLLAAGSDSLHFTPEQMRPTIIDGAAADWPIASAVVFAPVATLLQSHHDEQTIQLVNGCRYRLAAALFGDGNWARELAERLDVGHVSINDLIVPTADPRVPFGGCGDSGFGVTRGAEGLLAMTRPKVIAQHHGRLYLHLRPRQAADAARLMQALKWLHGR